MANETINRPALAITRGPLTVDNVRAGLKADRESAQLRQVTERVYPTGRANNTLFSSAAFGFQERAVTSTRMAWIDVPTGTTPEQVVEMLAHHPHAGLTQILSDEVILNDNQKTAILAGLTTVDIIKYGTDGLGGQLVRYGDNNTEGKRAEEFVPGPNGGEQFRSIAFVLDVTIPENADQDLRKPKVVNRPGTIGQYSVPSNQPATLTPETPSRFNIVDPRPTPSSERAANSPVVHSNEGASPIVRGAEHLEQGNDDALDSRPQDLKSAAIINDVEDSF